MKVSVISVIIFVMFPAFAICQDINKMNKSELREYIPKLTKKIDSLQTENANLKVTLSDLENDYFNLDQLNKANESKISALNSKIKISQSELASLEEKNRQNETDYSILLQKNKQNETDYSILQQKNKQNELEIQRLNALVKQIQEEKLIQISDKEDIIGELNQEIKLLNEEVKTLKESIAQIQSGYRSSVNSDQIPGNDFLNNYFFNQTPLNNETFYLSLSKVILGKVYNNNNDYYNDNQKGAVESLPELLDAENLNYWTVQSSIPISSAYNFNDLVEQKTSDDFSQLLPTIEILKNKLFTLIYSDGTEESFLFNVSKAYNNTKRYYDDQNNQVIINNNERTILQIELANEEVNADGSNNTARDIVWRIFAIENDCYLALTASQLNRLKLNLKNSAEGIEFTRNGQTEMKKPDDYAFHNRYNDVVWETTGEGIYLSRNQDSFMDTANYLDYNNIIYLFKLVR